MQLLSFFFAIQVLIFSGCATQDIYREKVIPIEFRGDKILVFEADSIPEKLRGLIPLVSNAKPPIKIIVDRDKAIIIDKNTQASQLRETFSGAKSIEIDFIDPVQNKVFQDFLKEKREAEKRWGVRSQGHFIESIINVRSEDGLNFTIFIEHR